MPNEIALKEIQVDYKLPVITFDVTPLKEQISKITKQYTGWVVKEEDIPAAKDVSAAMNNTAKTISDKRIAIVKAIKKPIDEFENELKSLTQELKDTVMGIKTQIDEFTEAEKENKRKQILLLPEWADYMTFDEKWLNKTTTFASIQANLEAQKKVFQTNVALVMAKCELYGLNPDKYVNALIGRQDVNGILNQINNDHEVKKEYTEPETIISVEEKPKEIRFNFVVEIVGTKKDFDLVAKFMRENDISFREV
jgi:hypothetical protein